MPDIQQRLNTALEGRYHMLVIGCQAEVERTYHFVSDDGETWEPVGDGLAFRCTGWHNFYTRPACLVPMGVGYLVELAKVTMAQLEEWKKRYPEAFKKAYDPEAGLRFDAWIE